MLNKNSQRISASSAVNSLSHRVIGYAMKVHSALGPGLLESTYEACLEHELRKAKITVKRQIALPVHYDGVQIDCGYRVDLLVENQIIIELKSVDKLAPIHEAQILTYLKLANINLGLLINFNVLHLRNGIKRIVNNLPEDGLQQRSTK